MDDKVRKFIDELHSVEQLGTTDVNDILGMMESTTFHLFCKLLHLEVNAEILDTYESEILNEEKIERLKVFNEVKSSFDGLLTLVNGKLVSKVKPKEEEDMEDV